MLELLVEYYEPIKKILLYLLIIILIFLILMKSRIKKYVLSNKETLKQNPITIPIVTYFDDVENKKTIISTFMEIIYAICKNVIELLLEPYYMIVDGFMSIFKSMIKVMNGVRKQIAIMRGMLFKIFDDLYIRLETVTGTMTYLFLKIREIMKKTYGMTSLMVYTAQHSLHFLTSLINSPVGSFAKSLGDSGLAISKFTLGIFGGESAWTGIDLCFAPETLVSVNGEDKHMIDVNIGDKIYDDTVIAKMIVKYIGQNMYKIKDTMVSGNHAIDINGNGIRVKDYMNNNKMDKYDGTELVCFVTDTGYIRTKDGTTFRDYLDTHDKHKHKAVKEMVKKHLQLNIFNDYNVDEASIDLLNGVILDDNVSIKNNEHNIIATIDIGPGNMGMFRLKNMNDNTLYSGGMLIVYNGKWMCIYEHPFAEYVEINRSVAKNWVVADDIILLSNGICVRDMIEVSDRKFNDMMNKYLLL
jgi:hypothetical protein